MAAPGEATPMESLKYILDHGTLEEAVESWEEILRLLLTTEGATRFWLNHDFIQKYHT